MRLRRALIAALAAIVVAFVALSAYLKVRCPGDGSPRVISEGSGGGPLFVGAARIELHPKLPSPMAGYGPVRPAATTIATPLFASAIALKAGSAAVTLVELDLLYVTRRMEEEIARGFSGLVLVIASHAHSSLGGFDSSLAARAASAGPYDDATFRLLVTAARDAVTKARDGLVPAQASLGETHLAEVSRARSGNVVDDRLTTITFSRGADPIGQLVIFSAHPTLQASTVATLDADWPGRVARSHAAVTLVLQGSGGNASATIPNAEEVASRVVAGEGRLSPTPLQGPADAALQWATVAFALPSPELHLTAWPWPARAIGAVGICAATEGYAMLSLVDIEGVRLLFTGFEPTAAIGRRLERATAARRAVGLAGGYSGYLDTEELVAAKSGESRLQYFGPELAPRVESAARFAAEQLR